ncbi:MAG: oligosaccharide flippase family protein [Tannerella sp.]|jgi:PST family polysaccharide transporter|nr:oligosaccharide flippase family protein [Tannerella sp.]
MSIQSFLSGKFALIVKNASYLTVFEVLKVAMPFIALPYLIHTVGEDRYGLVVFAQAIVACFSLIVNFGLDISAVRDVAQLRNDKAGLDELVSTVLIIKSGLCLLSFLLLTLFVQTIPAMNGMAVLLYFTFLTCVADVWLPVWYYQGKEQMRSLTVIRFFSVAFYTASVFVVIRSEGDYVYIPLLQSAGWIVSAAVSCYFLFVRDGTRIHLPPRSLIRRKFMESLPFFFSRVSLTVNAYMAKIMCGVFLSWSDVTAFDVAQKVCNGGMIPMQMFNQALYPNLSKSQNRDMLRRCLGITTLVTSAVALTLFFLSGWVTGLLSGGATPQAGDILRILCIYLFLSGFSIFLGTSALVAFGHQRPFNLSVILSTLVLLAGYAWMTGTQNSSIYLYALTLALAEAVVLGYRFCYCLKYELLRFRDMLPFHT